MTSAKYPANQQLTLTDAEDATLVARVTDLINEAYQGSEDGIWLESAARTSTDEVAGRVRANEIAVTRLSGEVVGCVRVQSLDAETSEFGRLAVPLPTQARVEPDSQTQMSRCPTHSMSDDNRS